MNLPQQIISQPGIYILIILLPHDQNLRIGTLGEFHFHAGRYAYIGSARGPGGLRARLTRHLRPTAQKKIHWHVDYLLQLAEIVSVCWSTERKYTECELAERITGIAFPPHFGASDCSCAGHLLQLPPVSVQNTHYLFIDADKHFNCIDIG